MAKRIIRDRRLTTEESLQQRQIREEFAERPGLDKLLGSGDFIGPMTIDEFLVRRESQSKTPVIASIQVGQPATRTYADPRDGKERVWTSAFFKEPVTGPVWASRTNLAGDRQADLENHGGSDKAVLAYSADHYAYWRTHLARPDLPPGAFGENLTIAGAG